MLYLARVVATFVVAAAGICEDGSCKEAPVDLLQSRVNVHAQSSEGKRCFNWPNCIGTTGTPCESNSNGGLLADLIATCKANFHCKWVSCHADETDANNCQRYMFSDTCDESTQDNERNWTIHEAFDESECMATCVGVGHCCNDPSISSNQYLSCAQGCKIRASGVSMADCNSACDEPRSCDRTLGDTTYTMCGGCTDITASCPHGVQSPSACKTGCDHGASHTNVVLWNFHSKRVLQAAGTAVSVPVHNFSSLDEARNAPEAMQWVKGYNAGGITIRDKTTGQAFFAGPPAGAPCNHNCEFGNNFGVADLGNNDGFENWEITEVGTEMLFGTDTPRFTIKNTNSGRKIFAQNSGGVGANSGKVYDDQTWYIIDVGA